MCPNVPRLGMNSDNRLETFTGRQRRPVTEMQEIVILQPLRQVSEMNDLPRLQLVPHGDGELLRLFGRIVHHAPDVITPIVCLGVGHLFLDLVDGDAVQILFEDGVRVSELFLGQRGRREKVVFDAVGQ